MEEFFTSKAKFKVLRHLFVYSQASYLRNISSFTKLPVRSVQVALKDLYNQQILIQEKVKNRTYYRINWKHKHVEMISEIFDCITNHEIKNKTRKYSLKAPNILKFNSELYETVRKAKRL